MNANERREELGHRAISKFSWGLSVLSGILPETLFGDHFNYSREFAVQKIDTYHADDRRMRHNSRNSCEFVRQNRVPVPDGVSGLQFRPAAPDASAGNKAVGGGKMLSGVSNVYDFLQGIVR
jgi:hypothetical protein